MTAKHREEPSASRQERQSVREKTPDASFITYEFCRKQTNKQKNSKRDPKAWQLKGHI